MLGGRAVTTPEMCDRAGVDSSDKRLMHKPNATRKSLALEGMEVTVDAELQG